MTIETVACIGSGLIGQGWATVFSSKGLDVVIQDQTDHLLETSVARIESNLLFLEAHGILAKGEGTASLKRITLTTEISEAVRAAHYVQESTPDRYDLKKTVFEKMDAAAPERSILASSSSGLLMTEIQKAVRSPERCILVHPMLPVHLIPLVEIAGGEKTSPDTVMRTRDLMEGLGKVPVVLNREVSGYIVNRLQAALLRESLDLVQRNVASAEDVDKAFRMGIGLRDPFIGPFLRIHLAGGGIERFFENFSESYRNRWETMETWTSIPAAAVREAVEGVREMEVVQNKTLEEIESWRDEMLMKILEIVRANH
jgi:3-hydroxypropionate dehydrogenase (NADP+)